MNTTFKETLLIVDDLLVNGSEIEGRSDGNYVKGYIEDHLIEFTMIPEAILWSNELISKVKYTLSINGKSINSDHVTPDQKHEIINMCRISGMIQNISMQTKSKSEEIKFYNNRLKQYKGELA